MYIKTTYEQEFDDLIMYLRSKYPQKLFDLDGIGEQLDMSKFSKRFFGSVVAADASIDANANVDSVSATSHSIEFKKPFERMNAYYMLWKELKRLYNHQTANEIIEMQLTGDIYIHDFQGFSSGLPYCYNYSTYDIMTKGLPMIDKIRSVPPKHLYSFKSQLEQFVTIAANGTLGATGLADLFITMSYYVKNILETKQDAHFTFVTEEDAWAYVKESVVSFIYTINQPSRSGLQSPYTNVSIFDDNFIKSMSSDYLFPDGSTPDPDVVKQIQELFIDIMNEEMERTPITFPVTTACFSIDEDYNILDEEFLEMISKKSLKYGFINIYAGKTSTISACCFRGSQPILVRDSSNGIREMPIEEYVNLPYIEKENLTVFHDGTWCKAKSFKTETQDDVLLSIDTVNKKNMLVTIDHTFPTMDGNKFASELTTDDYLLMNTSVLEPVMKSTHFDLSYDDGVLIGAYLGDGSIYHRTPNAVEITLSITDKKLKDIPLFGKWHINNTPHNCLAIKSYRKEVSDYLETWVIPGKAHEKRLSLAVLDQPAVFRQGILDGYYTTDGGNSNRIYTTSEGMVDDLEVLLTSLGKISVINVSDRTDEPVVIRGQTYKRNYPLYCIRWYSPKNQRSQKDLYIKRNGNTYFKINKINVVKSTENNVYCFEMKNQDEPYFTLPNGVVTHNCRLRSDMIESPGYVNSIGGSASKLGSLGVCSINFPRLAIKSAGNKETFFENLDEFITVCSKINNAKRKLIKKRIDNGNQPLYTHGFIDLDKQYSTVGVNGFYEAIEIMGHDILEEDGQEFSIEIMDHINDLNKKFDSQYKCFHNVEQVPAENMSIKMADKDKLLKYQDSYDIYSNQFIPLTASADLLDRIKIQGIFDSHFSGGSILHINVDTQIEDWHKMANLMKIAIKKKVVYHAINYVLSECEDKHLTVSHDDICPICGKEIIDKYTRVVGFLTSVKNWHEVRREQDFPNRTFYGELE